MEIRLTESRSQWMANELYFPTVEACLHKAWHQGVCFIVFMFKLFMISEKKKKKEQHTQTNRAYDVGRSHTNLLPKVCIAYLPTFFFFPPHEMWSQVVSSHQLWPPWGIEEPKRTTREEDI